MSSNRAMPLSSVSRSAQSTSNNAPISGTHQKEHRYGNAQMVLQSQDDGASDHSGSRNSPIWSRRSAAALGEYEILRFRGAGDPSADREPPAHELDVPGAWRTHDLGAHRRRRARRGRAHLPA